MKRKEGQKNKRAGERPTRRVSNPGILNDGPRAGRPSAYKPEFCEIVRKYYSSGATDRKVAICLGVCERTLFNWRAQKPEFLLASRVGKNIADSEVERTLYSRAVGYDRKVLRPLRHGKGVAYVEDVVHVPGDVAAQKHWLANRQPDRWRKKAHTRETDAIAPLRPATADSLTLIDIARKLRTMLRGAGGTDEDGPGDVDQKKGAAKAPT